MAVNNKIRAIVVDDESPARLMMKQLIRPHSDAVEIIAEAKDGKTAIKLINEMNPDVIFLDINIPDIGGFEILSKIKYQPFIIFTTAYEQYAIQAFETNSIDYLVKPIDEKRFAQSVRKLQLFVKNNDPQTDLVRLKNLFSELQHNKKPTTIPITIGDKIILLRLEDVVYLEAKEKYVYIITGDSKEYISDSRLVEFEETLPSNFLRVQKSFIVNKNRISEIHKFFGNRFIIIMDDKNKSRITSGVTYVNRIRESLGL